ncbi:hypothetical protein ACLVWU_09345 [Bdellovibrio sp. HCB290]|uniref:hypothetical protein n=1 Tax=Bdellovibrio sp. HCB290 TaxID=3394356 RepID=UPI0039B4C529
MTKNSLFILVVLIVVGFGIWFTKFGQELKRTQTLVTESKDDTQRLLKRRTAAVPEVTSGVPQNSLKKDQLQQEVQALSNQLLQENQKLDTQQQYLDQLRERSNPDRLEFNYRNQVSQAHQEIEYLTDTLNNDQFSESRLQQEVQRLQSEQDVSIRYYNQQMDQNILQQEAVVQKLQQDLQDWQLNFNDLTLQAQRVQELQGQLAEQTQLLQDMKVQKLQLAAQSLERTQQIQNQARDVASQNTNARSEIQEEINSLREEIQRLEYSYRQTRFTQMSAQAQIQQAERNLQGQEDVIRSIRELLQEKQTQLNQLQ